MRERKAELARSGGLNGGAETGLAELALQVGAQATWCVALIGRGHGLQMLWRVLLHAGRFAAQHQHAVHCARLCTAASGRLQAVPGKLTQIHSTLWSPSCQGDYDEERCRRIGNEHVRCCGHAWMLCMLGVLGVH